LILKFALYFAFSSRSANLARVRDAGRGGGNAEKRRECSALTTTKRTNGNESNKKLTKPAGAAR
jgi:hypothetical protein